MDTTSVSSVPVTAPTFENAINVRSRRNPWIVWSTVSLLVLVAGGFVAFHGYAAWLLARPTIAPLSSNPLEAVGLAYEDIEFLSSDGSSVLDGWYIPADDADRTVVFSHGYGGNREELWVPFYQLAKSLHYERFNVLLFDYGYVRPDRNATGGIRESLELQGAIDFAKSKGSRHTYVWGFSMGAGTALQTALHSKDIEAMVLDSTFLLEPDTLFHNIQQQANLPRFPSLALIRLFFPLLNGASLNQIPYQTVKETTYPMPILFIHGQQDLKAPYEMIEQLYEQQRATPRSDLWLLPDGQHELLYRDNKKQYLQRTMSFFNTPHTDSFTRK